MLLLEEKLVLVTRSHAMNATKRKWGANLQKVRVRIDGKVQRVYVSARALKSGKIERVINKKEPIGSFTIMEKHR